MAWDEGDEGFQSFLAKVGNHRIMTRSEEYDTARRARAGDKRARDKMIEHNLRLVLSIAQGYRNRGLGAADLVSEGIVGLHVAVDKFDPELGYRFTTYAAWWIRKYLQRGTQVAGGEIIRLPPHVRATRGKALAHLAQHPDATIPEVAAALGETPEAVLDALNAASVVASIHETYTGEEPLGDRYADLNAADPSEVSGFIGEDLAAALQLLADDEREVIELRFGLYGEALPIAEIAKRMRKQDHVVQSLQRKALAALRTGMLTVER